MKKTGVILVLLVIAMTTSANAIASDAPEGGAGGDAKFAWIEALKTDTTYYNPGDTVSVAVTVQRGNDTLAVVYDAVLQLTVKKDDSTIFETSENVNIPTPGGSSPMVFTVPLSEDAPLGTYSVRAELWSWGNELEDVSGVPFEVTSTSMVVLANKNVYNQGEPVVFTATNTRATTINLPSTAPWYVESVETGAVVYSPVAVQVITPLEPGRSLSWWWDQTNYTGEQAPPGIYRIGIHWDGMTNYTQEFEIQSIVPTPTPVPTIYTLFTYDEEWHTITLYPNGNAIAIDWAHPYEPFEFSWELSTQNVYHILENDKPILKIHLYQDNTCIQEDIESTKAVSGIWSYSPIPTPTSTPTPTPSPTPTPTVTPTPTPIPIPPGEGVVSTVKPLKVIYYVDVDKASKELVIDITLDNIGSEVIKDVHIQMETPEVLQRTLVLNATENPNGLYIGNLQPEASKTVTQRFKLTGKVEGDLEMPVVIKATGSDLQTILVITIVISEALLKLLQAGIIPGFEAVFAILGLLTIAYWRRRW